MGAYSKWVGDVHDFTDEEVHSFGINTFATEEVIGRQRVAWEWLMARPGAADAAAILAGDRDHAGMLRRLAEGVFVAVTAAEEGQVKPVLPAWRKEVKWTEEDLSISLRGFAEGQVLLIQGQLTTLATMAKAIPDYNQRYSKSRFGTKLWSKGVKSMFNKVLYRLEVELEVWSKLIVDLPS